MRFLWGWQILSGNEKIEKSLKLKEGILENTSFFTVEKTEIDGRQEISVNKIEIDETIAKIILSTYMPSIDNPETQTRLDFIKKLQEKWQGQVLKNDSSQNFSFVFSPE